LLALLFYACTYVTAAIDNATTDFLVMSAVMSLDVWFNFCQSHDFLVMTDKPVLNNASKYCVTQLQQVDNASIE